MKTKDHRDPSGPDMELERDLQSIRDGLASQGYEEPPAMLDQAVLNAARRDLEAKKRRPLRWVGTFATAAVLVLTLTIVVQQDDSPVPAGATTISEAQLKKQSMSDGERKRMIQSEPSADEGAGYRQDRTKEDTGPSAPEPAQRKMESELNEATAPLASPPAPVMTGRQAPDQELMDSLAADSDTPANQTASSLMVEEIALAESEEDAIKSWLSNPEQWIERLLELKENQQVETLQQEMKAFQNTFPEHPLPAELND
jgi:hypothetical protein